MSRKRLQPSERRDQLIEFGRDHFADHAFDALAIEEIARLADVSKGTLYNYFGGRRGFYIATITAVVHELLVAIEPPDDVSVDEAIRTMLSAFVDYAADHSGIYLALVRGGLGADEEVGVLLESVRASAVGHATSILGLGALDPRLDLALTGWVAFVEATTARWITHGGIGRDALVDLYINNLLNLVELSS